MPPKNTARANSSNKKRSRVTVDTGNVSDTDEVLPAKTTKRTYAFYNPVDSKPAGSTATATQEKKITKSKPTQRSSKEADEQDDDSASETLKRRPRPKPSAPEAKGSNATSTTATVKETAEVKNNGSKSRNEASLSNNSSGRQRSSKKQPLAAKQQPSEELDNQENRSLSAPAREDQVVIKKTKNQRASPSMSFEQLQAAYDDLVGRYNHLSSLRTTEAEQHLEEYRDKLQAANRTLEQYRTKVEPQLEVRSLQHQLRDYEAKEKQRALEDRMRERTISMEKLLASPDVSRQSASFVKAMEMYENLTGLKVTACNQHLWGTPSSTHPSKVYPETWECEHSGPLGITYVPAIDPEKDSRLLQALPEYMTVEIEFERQFESKLFWRILNYNHDQDDEA
ncbi:hypothetical protein BGZ73_005509 [Actinomortierella ambigua]|nr:hypothetical protein BGZ73_005509 [Actinomortierella ambigua]